MWCDVPAVSIVSHPLGITKQYYITILNIVWHAFEIIRELRIPNAPCQCLLSRCPRCFFDLWQAQPGTGVSQWKSTADPLADQASTCRKLQEHTLTSSLIISHDLSLSLISLFQLPVCHVYSKLLASLDGLAHLSAPRLGSTGFPVAAFQLGSQDIVFIQFSTLRHEMK